MCSFVEFHSLENPTFEFLIILVIGLGEEGIGVAFRPASPRIALKPTAVGH